MLSQTIQILHSVFCNDNDEYSKRLISERALGTVEQSALKPAANGPALLDVHITTLLFTFTLQTYSYPSAMT